jgi:hypothetical protein
METEPAQRENDGIALTLVWHGGTDRLTVKIRDDRNGESFDLAAHARIAKDVSA